MARERCCTCKSIENLYVVYTLKSGVQNFRCRDCNTKNHKKYRQSIKGKDVARKAVAKYRKRNPEKIKAHGKVHEAIGSGKLIKKPCVSCGEIKVAAHHEDYTKPLTVIWVCRRCHEKIHHKDLSTVVPS